MPLTRALLAVIAFVAGFSYGTHVRDAALYTSLRAVLESQAAGFGIETPGPPAPLAPILTRLELSEDAALSERTTTLRGEARALHLNGVWHPVAGGLILSIGGGPGARAGAQWTAGRVLEAPLSFRRPARYLNDGVPDLEVDLALSGATLFASAKSGLLVEVRERGSAVEEWAAAVRRHVRGAIDAYVGGRDPLAAAIVTAVLIGDRTGLPDAVRDRLQAAGTYHVIAISGGNIAILAALCVGLLRLVGLAGRPAAALAMLVLLAYAQVVTAGPSVWRATLMALLYFAARLLDHRTPARRAFVVTAIVVIGIQPLEVRDVGFLLTFGATAALLDMARRLEPRNPRGPMPKSTRRTPSAMLRALRGTARWALLSMAASVAVEAVLLPIGAHTFSRITVAGLFLNLVAIPAMAVVQIAGLAVAFFESLETLAAPAGWLAAASARTLVDSARIVDVLPWLSARVPPPSILLVAVYYALLALVVLTRGWRRVASGCGLVAAGMFVGGVPLPNWATPAPLLRLTAFDVGQGDSLLLQTPGGRTLLIDTGGAPFGSGFDIGGRVLAPALWARGVRSLDALLLTHGDPDHAGGARSILADFEPHELWEGIPVPRHRSLQELHAEAAKRGVRMARRRAGEELALDGVRLRVLHPPLEDWARPRVRNDDSVVIEALYGDVAILLTGDIGADVERDIVPQLTPARIRVLKVGHHGSRTSTSAALLERWRPQIAIISAGRGNTFGHPTPEVVRRLEEAGATVYRTDRDGQIALETDGSEVVMRTYVGGTP